VPATILTLDVEDNDAADETGEIDTIAASAGSIFTEAWTFPDLNEPSNTNSVSEDVTLTEVCAAVANNLDVFDRW
jgi:hypothetical protein